MQFPLGKLGLKLSGLLDIDALGGNFGHAFQLVQIAFGQAFVGSLPIDKRKSWLYPAIALAVFWPVLYFIVQYFMTT